MVYLKLVRWPNLIIISIIFLLIKTQLVDPLAANATAIQPCLSDLHWTLMALATVLIAASGNVVNDIFDQEIDRINKPDRMIVGRSVTEEQAWNFYYAISSFGLGVGILVCWQLGNVSNSLIFMMSLGGLYFYSYSYKRQFLIGNVVVALLAALVPLMPVYLFSMCEPELWMQLPWTPLLFGLAFFSFITTMIRELIKDMEDEKGDRLLRCRTVPIVIGTTATKVVVSAFIAVLLMAVGKLQLAWWMAEDRVLFIYFMLAMQVPSIVLAAMVWKAKIPDEYHRASNLAKGVMLGGILSMLFFRTLLP